MSDYIRTKVMEDYWLAKALQEAIEIEIQELSIQYGMEPADMYRLLDDWANWQNENINLSYLNRN